MNKGSAASSLPVPWDRLREWIDAQEAAEQQGNHSAPLLSRAQLGALSHFVEFVGEEPDVSDLDYVSRLMHLIQMRGLRQPVFKDLDPIEVPAAGVFSQRWQTVCILASCGREMPCVGYGVEEGEEAPMFKSKKMAKQYAAKQALAFLSGSPPNRQAPPRSVQGSPGGASLGSAFSPVAKRPLSSDNSLNARPSPALRNPAVAGTAAAAAAPIAAMSPERATKSPEPAERFNSDFDDAVVFSRVATLAGRLGFESPSYQVDEGERLNFYSARPVFRNGGRVPPDLGVVTGIYGKKQAKQEAALAVLAWLVKENETRQEMTSSLLEGL